MHAIRETAGICVRGVDEADTRAVVRALGYINYAANRDLGMTREAYVRVVPEARDVSHDWERTYQDQMERRAHTLCISPRAGHREAYFAAGQPGRCLEWLESRIGAGNTLAAWRRFMICAGVRGEGV